MLDQQRNVGVDSIPCLVNYNRENPSSYWCVYSHGNGCDIGQMFEELNQYSRDFHVNTIAYEYPGYGISPGDPSGDACKHDHEIIVAFLWKILGVATNKIIFFGRSIGTGIASYVCRNTEKVSPVGALILQSPYISIREIAVHHVGTVGYLAPNPLDNITTIKELLAPVIFIHGERDNLILAEHSRVLYQNSNSEIKALQICLESDHNYWQYDKDLKIPISSFLSKVFPGYPDSFHEIDVNQQPLPEIIFHCPDYSEIPETKGSSIFSSLLAPFVWSKNMISGESFDKDHSNKLWISTRIIINCVW